MQKNIIQNHLMIFGPDPELSARLGSGCRRLVFKIACQRTAHPLHSFSESVGGSYTKLQNICGLIKNISWQALKTTVTQPSVKLEFNLNPHECYRDNIVIDVYNPKVIIRKSILSPRF